MTRTHLVFTVATLCGAAHTSAAQVPNASAAAFGMAGNYSAAARGYDAVAWNPAMLGMPGGSWFTLNLLSGGGISGLNPVTLSDLAKFDGIKIDAATKEEWLQRIGTGQERGGLDGGVSLVALSIGRIGLQVGVTGTAAANLNADAVEALLFGNAGRTGAPKSLTLAGSSASGSAFVTGAASVAFPTPLKPTGRPNEHFSIGVTGKYVSGAMGRAQDNGSLVTPDNIAVSFPAIYSPGDSLGEAGSGVGIDVGIAWSAGANTFGATVRNVVNTFAWNTSALVSTVGTVDFNGTTGNTNFTDAPYSAAPAAIRAAVEAEKFKPEIAVGFARRTARMTLSVDASQRIGDGIEIGPKMHVGVGAEWRVIPFLPLRAGVAAVTDGFQVSGGAGIDLGPVEIGVGISRRSRSNGSEYGAMFSLISIR